MDVTRACSILGHNLRWPFTWVQLKRAYKQTSLQKHPDKNRGSPISTAEFQEVREAYDHMVKQMPPQPPPPPPVKESGFFCAAEKAAKKAAEKAAEKAAKKAAEKAAEKSSHGTNESAKEDPYMPKKRVEKNTAKRTKREKYLKRASIMNEETMSEEMLRHILKKLHRYQRSCADGRVTSELPSR